jgi:Holliday junction resolvase RusA-like endonuclease
MIHRFEIPGTMPNLNDYLKAERVKFRTCNGKTNTKGNELKKQWQHYVGIWIRKYLRDLQIVKPVFLQYTFYEPNMKRDLDNIASFSMKIIQDSLVDTGVLRNDGWRNVVGFNCNFFVDADNPRIEVMIVEVSDG